MQCLSTRPETRRLRIEALEERTLLAVFSVTNINDSGDGSLRQAVLDANSTAGEDTIAFSSLFDTPQTINLTSAQLTLTDAAQTTITGPGAHRLAVSGSGQSRVFEIGAGASASLSGLTITGGNAGQGGGLFNSGTVSLTKVAVRGNAALFSGGGLLNIGAMTLVDCTISGNGKGHPFAGFVSDQFSVLAKAGGVHNYGTLSMTNCTISGNVANFGAGLYNAGSATLVNCTITGNRSNTSGGTAGVDSINQSTQSGLTMYNTIVTDNLAEGIPSDVAVLEPPLGPGIVGSHNLIGGDAKLGALADYGGSMLTMMPAADSPVHGAGTTGPGIPTTDQMGNIRPAQPSIGAMEGNYELTVTTTDNRGPMPGEVTLAVAVHRANLIPGPNTIQFSSLFDAPQTIDHQAPMVVTDPAGTTIDGQDRLTLSGGGSITVRLGSLALSSLTITGGSNVLRNLGGDVALSGVTVTGNLAINRDAVIQNGGPDPSVLFTNNADDPRDPYSLLPIQRDFGGTMTLTGCTINDNDTGGFVEDESIINNRSVFVLATGLVHEASLTITESTISGNGKNSLLHANVVNTGLLTMSRSTVSDNEVRGTGGGLVNNRIATLIDSTFSGNRAGTFGGGLFNQYNMTLINCTVTDNTAAFINRYDLPIRLPAPISTVHYIAGGGGLFNVYSLTLVNSTVSGNTVSDDPPGGFFVDEVSGGGLLNLGTVTLSNTIIAGNTAPTQTRGNPLPITHDVSTLSNPFLPALVFISQGHNLIGISDNSTGWGATDLTGTAAEPLDPLLAPLGDYGGPTWTRPPLAGSPAIDAGDPFFHSANTGILYDQRGEPRVVRGAAQTETNDVVGLAEIKFGTTGELIIVTPTDAFASTYFSGLQLPVNLIDNSGLDTSSGNVLTYTHAPHGSAVGMWAAGNGQGGGNPAPVVDDQYIVLDLGANHDLSQAYLWQMVQTNLLGRGIKEFRLYGSPAAPSAADKANPPAVYNLAGYSVLLDTTTLAPGPQSGPSTTQAFALTGASNVRTIYIDVISSYNTGPRIDIGAVEVQPNPLPGDYNGNDIVDAADFTVWRDTLGTGGLTQYSGADGNGNGTIDHDDYAVWTTNFGNSLPSGGGGGLASAAHESDATVPGLQAATESLPLAAAAMGDEFDSTSAADPLMPAAPGDALDEQVWSRIGVAPHSLRTTTETIPFVRSSRRSDSTASALNDAALIAWLANSSAHDRSSDVPAANDAAQDDEATARHRESVTRSGLPTLRRSTRAGDYAAADVADTNSWP